jgi:hypothetical protein
MGLNPVFRKGSKEHEVLDRLRRGASIGPDPARRTALAHLVEAGLATGGAESEITALGRTALKRIESNGRWSPPLGHHPED